MGKQKKNGISRRSFIGTSLIGVAGISLLPGCGLNAGKKNINLGFIGVGQQAMFLAGSFMKIDGVKLVACADVYGRKRERFVSRVNSWYKEKGVATDVIAYEDYKELLARPDIDAVVIATPDHWHAMMAIDACLAGKDIYLEKPLTFTIEEGQKLVKTVRDNRRILAVGSQQRSDPGFSHAVKMVRDGRIGDLEKIQVYVGTDPHPQPNNLPEEAIPDDLNWELWLGPNPWVHFNNEMNPPISLDPPVDEQLWGAWRWYRETGGGLMTDWGAHMFDIAQWALDMDHSGPVKVIPEGFEGTEYLTYIYANGVEMTLEPYDGETRGVKFIGSTGWIEISRDSFKASDDALKPAMEDTEVPYEARSAHHINFIEALRNRKDPVVPVETGHRTCTVCNLGNIAFDLGRPVEWDPAAESFVNDPEAEAMKSRTYREGYHL